MKEWFISGWIHLVIGFVIGWIVFKQPEWAKNLAYSLWDKIKGLVRRK